MEWLLNNRLAHFDCEDFGLETHVFTQHVLKLMHDASWDRYDTRRRRLEYLLLRPLHGSSHSHMD